MKIAIVGPFPPIRGGMAGYNEVVAHVLSGEHEVQRIEFGRYYRGQRGDGEINLFAPWTWYKVGRKLRTVDTIIFRYRTPLLVPCYVVILWAAGVHTICICDNVIPHERTIFDRSMARLLFRQVDAFVVHSLFVLNDLLKLVPNATYLKTPLPQLAPRPGLPKGFARERLGVTCKRVILFFGMIRPHKGLDDLLEAMKSLPDVELLIAGESFGSVPECGGNVRVWLEYAPDSATPFFFSAADLVVLPYRSATQSAVIPLAHHYGRGVIVTDVGGLPEQVLEGKNGLIIPPHSPSEIAEAVKFFYANDLAGVFEIYALQADADRSWVKFTKQIGELL